MNEALERRVFLVAMVVCLSLLGLAGGLKYVGNIASGEASRPAIQQQAPSFSQDASTASATQQLAAVSSDIASSNADLAQIPADTGGLQDK